MRGLRGRGSRPDRVIEVRNTAYGLVEMQYLDLRDLCRKVDGERDFVCRQSRKLLSSLKGYEKHILSYPCMTQNGKKS